MFVSSKSITYGSSSSERLPIGGSTILAASINTSEFQKVLDNARSSARTKCFSTSIIFGDDSEINAVANAAEDTYPVTSNMHFSVGSATKMFIAGCIFKLIEEKKLTLDDTLQKLLYDPNIPDTRYKLSSQFARKIDPHIRIKDLLNHTTGIDDFLGFQYYYDIVSDVYAKWDPPKTLSYVTSPYYTYDYSNPANNQFYYSNTDYILLGMIIENITGKKILSVVTNYFLEPLKMKNTFMAGVDPYWGLTSIPAPNAIGFLYIGGIWIKCSTLIGVDAFAVYTSTWTSGNMISTASDMARWAKYYYHYQLDNGYIDGSDYKRFWSPADADELKNVCSTCTREYGLCMMKFDFSSIIPGCIVYGHTGMICGYNGFSMYWPGKDISFAVFTNNDAAYRYKILVELLEYLNTIY